MDWSRAAALNNAQWCDVVCRSHGIQTRFDDDAWTSPTRTPLYYPDAVTLVPEVSAPELLARTDTATGCSVKDSFASLDLTGYGFEVLFDAQWIALPETKPIEPVNGQVWELVRDGDDLTAWLAAWRGDEGPFDVLRADVLGHESVAVLAARSEDGIAAGAIATRGAGVVGISNLFATDGVTSATWCRCAALARSVFPHATLVGYESGTELTAAQQAGFELAGPLLVWIRND